MMSSEYTGDSVPSAMRYLTYTVRGIVSIPYVETAHGRWSAYGCHTPPENDPSLETIISDAPAGAIAVRLILATFVNRLPAAPSMASPALPGWNGSVIVFVVLLPTPSSALAVT